MAGRTIIVFGGAGYIGSHACKELKKQGYSPVVYDNLSNGFQHLVKWGEFEKGDICNKERVIEVLKKHKPIAVMHFAAHISVAESVENPYKYYHNNVYGTLQLLKAMEECGVKNIIFSSTAAVYGMPQTKLISEEHPKVPINPYGRSKLMVEQLLADFQKAYNINYIALRYFNAAGADIDGETGCDQVQSTNLLPIVMKVLDGKQDKLKIFGNDYDTPDGTCIRDYIHVSDLALAHISALEYLLKNKKSDIFNLGTGRGYSVKEVVDATERVLNKKLPFEFVERRKGDSPILVSNPAKAEKLLKWKAEHSNIDKIISTSWRWSNKKV